MTKTEPAAGKLTRNQQIVFGVLNQSEGPLTAYEILNLEVVRDEGLKAPLTIYRALESLLKKGLAHRIESINAFVACRHKGPHETPAGFIICTHCRRTEELSSEACEPLLRKKAEARGFELQEISIELKGLCRGCRS